MAYLKLVFDELEIAHLSEDGQYLCANKGVPQYRTDYLDFVCTDQEGKLIRPNFVTCLLYTSPSPRDVEESRMPSSA